MALSNLLKLSSGYAARAQGAMTAAKARSHIAMARGMRMAETALGAFTASALTTKLGGPNGFALGPIPLSLGVAGLLYGAAVFNLGGSYNQDLANFADGCFAAYWSGVGREFGQGRWNFKVGAVPNRRGYHQFLGNKDTHRRAA